MSLFLYKRLNRIVTFVGRLIEKTKMNDKKPLILVTNDDGISSKGIRSLYESVKDFGEIMIVAPDSPQSGMGHAITINDPLRTRKSDLFDNENAIECSGTPADCVKLGFFEVGERMPDLVVSGINHGSNAATNVLYSGTMSASVEAALGGVPSIGFSLCSFDSDADFTVAKKVVKHVTELVLSKGIFKGTCLNVNIPDVEEANFKGVKVCHAASAHWEDSFEKRKDQFGRTYYWLAGSFIDKKQEENNDLYWLEQGYATVVPIQYDMTNHRLIQQYKEIYEK